MKLTRKPLTIFFPLMMLGFPADIVWGYSDVKYSLGSVYKHGNGNGLLGAGAQTKIALNVADVIRDVKRINHHSSELKQRVLLLELQLAKTLRKYQTEISETAAVENSHSVRTSSAGEKLHLMPAKLAFMSIQEPFKLNIAPPALAIAEEPTATEPEVLAMPKKIDEEIAKTAPNETDVLTVVDSCAALDEIVEPSIIGDELAMNDTTLSEMRGGFTTTSGLQVTFGIERVVYINGALISTTSINVLNLGNVPSTTSVATNVAGRQPRVADLSSPSMTLPQTNAGAPAASTSIPGNVEPSSTATPATAASASSTVASVPSSTPLMPANVAASSASPAAVTSATSNVPSSTQVSYVNGTPVSVALIQSGAGNAVSSGAFSTLSAGTVVQNTLNNQKIQNMTVINATVNSMQILKALNLQASISSAINDSVRK